MSDAPRRSRTIPSAAVATVVSLLMVAVALSGCTRGTGDDDARLEYDGSGHGTHSDTAVCDQDAHLTVTASVRDGLLAIHVRDGDDTEIYTRTIDSGLDIRDHPLEGSEGPWNIEAMRSESFEGFYNISLDCESDRAESGNATDYERKLFSPDS